MNYVRSIFRPQNYKAIYKFTLRRSTIFHYEACTDKLDVDRYFKQFQLPDTLFSFFLVSQLHVWMCQARSMREDKHGRFLRNELMERMWQDLDTRISKIDTIPVKKRRDVLQDLMNHHQAAIISYDEGLMKDDKTLAAALWRTLYSKEDVDPKVLELGVKYVRTQIEHLRSIGSKDWCEDGKIVWAACPPIIPKNVKRSSPSDGDSEDSISGRNLEENQHQKDTKNVQSKDNRSELPANERVLSAPSETSLQKAPPEMKDLRDVESIPAEVLDEPRPYCFQQLKMLQDSDPIFTLQKAAEFEESISPRMYFRYPKVAAKTADKDYFLRGIDNKDTFIAHFPDRTDYLVVGGGLIGSATAYYLKRTVSRMGDVLVVDKDPYSPHNCTALSCGLISSQSKSVDISRVATLSKELIRQLRHDVLVTRDDFAKIKYRPVTHLILWPESGVDEVLEATSRQINDGLFTVAKLPSELETSFPWLKVCDSDVALGTHGNQDEALVDPVALRNLYRTIGQAHGVNFIVGDVVDWNTLSRKRDNNIYSWSAASVVVKIPTTGELRNLGFAMICLTTGHNTPFLEARSEMETYVRDQHGDMHFLQPRLRVQFSFHSLNAPIINFPVITDTDGSILVRDDYAGSFKYYCTYKESETFTYEDDITLLSPNWEEPYVNLYHKHPKFKEYFETVIKPKLVKRIPSMADAQFELAFSGYEDFNSHDGCPIISPHPYHSKVCLSGGYGQRLVSYAPAAAMAFAELCIYQCENTFDMTNFYWSRVYGNRKVEEFNSLTC